jgi:2,3-bisphosphoglycerate-dependent phosphoglycerate mutase
MSEEEILNCNIPTGVPLVYELDDNMKPIKNYYLGNLSEIQEAMKIVANQGKSKN